jgi:hypothetical protein
MMVSPRSHALIQIIQIEDQVKLISSSMRYRKIQQYLRILKNTSGKAIIEVENPNDMGAIIQLRKNSVIAKEYLVAYELLLYEYDVLFNELRKRKNHFKAELFG